MKDTAKRVESVALNIRSYGLSRRLTWKLLQQSLEKSVEHALGTTMISLTEGKTILHGIYRHMLPALGVVRTFPLAMRHVPFHFGGLGIHHPYHERGRQQLELLLQHQGEASQTSRLIEDSIEQVQLQVGSEVEFWAKPYSTWGVLVALCWIEVL